MREEKLKELLVGLTLKEKIGQLIQLSGEFFTQDKALLVGPQEKLGIAKDMVSFTGSVLNVLGKEKVIDIQKKYLEQSRHKIPLLFMADIIYGYKTVYPIPLAFGCTFEPDLIQKAYHETAKEAAKDGANVTFAPMVDLVRDARWGRCMESTGEDPYLNAAFARAMVKGFQGDFTPGESIASCVKHFAGYGAGEAGREYNTVDMSERRLRQEQLPSYKAAVDAGCELVMTSFNTIDEIPATANEWLLKDVLREEWGFDGVIITDYAAIAELVAHGIAEDEKEASYLAIKAGVDIDMKTACYANQLEPLIEEEKINIQAIDQAVWRILKLKNKLGLFENPFAGIETEEADSDLKRKHEIAKEVASKSCVLLKNQNHVLPLRKEQKVALIGPYADSKDLVGLWAIHADRSKSVTLKEAFEQVAGTENISYTKGCDLLDDYTSLGDFGNSFMGKKAQQMTETEAKEELNKALMFSSKADVVVLALGEHMMQSGEAGSRTDITLPSIQKDLLRKISETGKPIVLILFNGRPLVLKKEEPYANAILEAWFPGTEGANAIADIIFGDINPSGKLTMSFPYAIGQIPVYYSAFQTGRPVSTSTHSQRFMSKYLDCQNDPFYCFGYGLSYTTFEYKNLILDKTIIKADETLKVTVEVTNTGTSTGEETVQLYIRDIAASVVRPVKELKDFKKITLKPNETQAVTFALTVEKLKFYTKDMEYKAEEGRFEVFAGGNSMTTLKADFYLKSE